MKFKVFTSHFVRSRAIFDGDFFAFDVSCAFLCLYHHRIQRVEQSLDDAQFVLIEGDSSFGGFPHAIVMIQIIMTNVYATVVVVHFCHRVASDVLFEIGWLSSNCVFHLLFRLRQQQCKRFKLSFVQHNSSARGITDLSSLGKSSLNSPSDETKQTMRLYLLIRQASQWLSLEIVSLVCFRFHSTTENCDFLAKNPFRRWILWSRRSSFSLLCRFSR